MARDRGHQASNKGLILSDNKILAVLPAPLTKPVLPELSTNNPPADTAKKELFQIQVDTKAGEQLKLKISPNFEISFRWCPPGQFTMGNFYGEKGRALDEFPHVVKFSKGFWIAEIECSQVLWVKIMKSNPSIPNDRDLPVNNVSHRDIIQFLAKINKEGSELPKFDLPTESQWEYACRAGAKTPFNIRQAITSLNSRLANFDGRHPYGVVWKGVFLKKSLKPREYPPNSWGIYDMHGNMLE